MGRASRPSTTLATQEVEERVRTKRVRSVAVAAVVTAGLVLVVSACGGGSSSGTTTSTTAAQGKTFPLLKVVWGTTDYLDPGLSYRLQSWQLFQDVYLGLLQKQYQTCAPVGDCTKIIPAIAESLPTVNSAGTDFKFTIRKGLKFSNGETIKASDFKNSIIRDFKLNSPGIGFYSNIVGIASCEANPTKCSDISGIVVNDGAGTVEIKLMKPQSDFEYILTTPFSAIVPSSTPNKDTESPPPAADGPYYFSSYKPSRSFVMLRNPHWTAIPGIPTGNPNKVVGLMTGDQAQSAQYVTSGQYNYDENTLPTDRLKQLQAKYGPQIKLWRTPSTNYFFMNERLKPFNNIKAREAVNYAINRQTLVSLYGGLGVPTWNFLPPTYPQYKKITPTPYPYNLSKAKQLVQQSGTAGMTIGVYTESDVANHKAAGEYLAQQLGKIGWKTQLHELASANYFVVVGNQATKAQIGYTDWFEDYPYPTDWFQVLEYGPNIHQIHNNNNSNVDFSSTNSEINKLSHLPPSQAFSSSTTNSWAALDKTLMTKYVSEAPFLNEVITSFFSANMNPNCDVFDDWFDDVAEMCMK
jgi:peptide/nickel transport system substrate-binding protein